MGCTQPPVPVIAKMPVYKLSDDDYQEFCVMMDDAVNDFTNCPDNVNMRDPMIFINTLKHTLERYKIHRELCNAKL
jgi:hypothetical protein